MIRRFLFALLLLIVAAVAPAGAATPNAFPSGGIVQGGIITPGHVPVWCSNGVLCDGGSAAFGALKELGITGMGNVFCIDSNKAPYPYNQFCIGFGPSGLNISNTAVGGSTLLPMNFIVGGVTGLSISQSGFTLGNTLNVAGGGTGVASLTPGNLLVGNGTGPVQFLAPGIAGTCVTSNGSQWTTGNCGSGGGGGGTVTSIGTGTGLTGGNITTIGTISLAPINNSLLLANTSGITTAPTPTTLTALIDSALGVTRGSLLERGLSGWQILVPSATPKQALISQGVGNDPIYANIVNSISSTSGLTVSGATGDVQINLGPIANNTLMANISGVNAPAISTTPSALLDSAFGSTVGALLYRSGGGWAIFAPGSAGQVLATGGVNAPPVWQTISGTGTVTSVTCGTGLSGGTITGSGTCSISAPVVVSLGGTGNTSLTAHGLVVGEGTSAAAVTAAGAANSVLIGNGGSADPTFSTLTALLDTVFGNAQGDVLYRGSSAWAALTPGTGGQVLTTGGAAANPSWTSVGGTGTVTSVTAGTGLSGGTFTSSGTISLTAPVTVALGGTGNTTLTAHGVLVGEGTGAVVQTAAGANFNPLVGQGPSGDPIFTTVSAMLDGQIGFGQGQIIYRGASGWVALGAGTAGQILSTGGAGANPSWVNAGTGSGSVTSVTCGTGLSGGTITSTGTCSITAPVTVALGGQGRTTLTAHAVLLGEGTAAVNQVAPGATGTVLTSTGTGTDPTWQTPSAAVHGSMIGVQTFAVAGASTYTPDAGTFSVVVECLGGGAAGGGAAATSAGQNSAGAGGTAGSYSRSNIASGFSGVTVTVGAGGTGVSGAAGNGGGQSSFGALLTCPGGGGGSTPAAGTAVGITAYSTPGALATGGNLSNGAGMAGLPGICVAATTCQAGMGGASVIGGGGKPGASGATGGAALAAGAGGSGALNIGSSAAQTGGVGGAGLVIVYEFS